MKIISLLALSLLSFSGYGQTIRDLYKEGLEAYESKNYELFREKMKVINEQRPNYPAVVYNLAGGNALTNNKNQALKVLNQYILMDALTDFTKDSDFQSLLEDSRLNALLEKRDRLARSIPVKVGYSFDLLSSHPESITYSEKQNSFFLGGVRDGSIWRMELGKEPELWAKSPKDSWSVMGLEITGNKTLWVCTSSMSNYIDYKPHEEGYASVLKYNLKNGKLLETYTMPGGHNFGDLISDSEGNIYISDGTANKLFIIDTEVNELKEFLDLSEKAFNLQGLTYDAETDAIYVTDYIDGIYGISLPDRSIHKINVKNDDVLLKGIDGLYYRDDYFIALHNGTKPNRVIKYYLSEDKKSIVDKEILAQADSLGEPTQGVWVEDKFHFIANSPWGYYDRDGNFNLDRNTLIIGVLE